MSRKKKETKAPKPPAPSSSYYYDGRNLRSSTVYNPANNSYINRVYQTPAEIQAQNLLQQQYNSMLSQVGQTTPEQLQRLDSYEQDFFQKVKQPLEEELHRGTNQARESFNSTGFMNSTGYEDYRLKNLDKLYQDGLRQASVDAKLSREQVAQDYQKQLLDNLGYLSGALNTNISNALNQGGISTQSASNLNQYNLDNYSNYLKKLESQRLQRQAQSQQRADLSRMISAYMGYM